MSQIEPKPYLQEVSIRREPDINFSNYPFCVPAIREMGVIKFHPDVTFFVGENGAGKSTLLEAIAITMGFSPEGGTKNTRFETVIKGARVEWHLLNEN